MSEKLSKIDIKDLQTAEVIQKVIIPKLKNIDQDIKDLTLEVLTRKDDAIKAIEETGKEFVDKIKEQVGPQGGKGDKGDKGESYLLTSKDKREIAKLIDVPVVDKIIEKVEVIVEKPTVTNNEIIKEVAKYESPEEVTKKINTLSEVLEMSTIKGLKKLLSEIVQNIGGQVAPSVTRFISIFSNGTLSKSSASEINFGPNMTVTATPNGVFVDSASGGGGGSSTYTGLTDAATADLPTINTPLSNALASKATPADISTAISNLVDTAPATLDTLNELANALGNDPNFATTITTQIGNKENSSNKVIDFVSNITSNTFFPTVKAIYDWATGLFATITALNSHTSNTSNPHSVTKAQVGLSNVDNTSDVNKPISTATQSALDGKVNSNTAITGATKTKVTYDAKGLVTAGADATTADIADSVNKRYVTDAQLTVISNTSNINTGDQTSIVGITGTTAQFNTALTDGDFATLAGTETLTNKKIVRRVSSATSTATLTPTYGTYDDYYLTAQAVNLTLANPTGTPTSAEMAIVMIKPTTGVTLTLGTAYRTIGTAIPATLTANKWIYIGLKYNTFDTKVDTFLLAQEA